MSSSNAKVKSVSVEPEYLSTTLEDGRIIRTPLSWYPTLYHATKAQRKSWKPCEAGRGIHWPLLDFHLSIQGMLDGAHEAGGITRSTLAQA